jgi:cell wall assembly regulator SMI1
LPFSDGTHRLDGADTYTRPVPDAGVHDEEVARAWSRIEAGLSRVLPASLELLGAPAGTPAIDTLEAALQVVLPSDFRRSLCVHNGTSWPHDTGHPSPVPLDRLYDTIGIVEATRMWRGNYHPEPGFDDPRYWAREVDRRMVFLNGPVWPIIGSPTTVVVGDLNGDVQWLLDLDPAPGGTPGQVVRVDIECATWDVLAPSWTQLLVRYAEDLERFAADPDSSALDIDQGAGPACEWGCATPELREVRPAWLRGVPPLST